MRRGSATGLGLLVRLARWQPPPGLRVGEPVEPIGEHLRRLVARVAVGVTLAAVLSIAALDRQTRGQVALALAHMAIVVVASWQFAPIGQWATVALATLGWTVGTEWPSLGWPPALSPGSWGAGGLRLGALASAAATVITLRSAALGFLRAEDTLALTLLREHDSARRDRLTRLWNARYLHEALEREIGRCRRYGRPFGLLLIDLDGFKAVNDSAGHEAGDRVLQVVGQVIRTSCRATDIPARLGGDEFAVILPEASSLTVPRYGAKLVELIARAPFPAGLPRVTASVGGAAFAGAPASAKAALAVADEAMYAAKRQGKNRLAVIEPAS